MAPKETDNRGKGRLQRVGGMTTVLAAVILIILNKIYPRLNEPSALATSAVLLALMIAAALNLLFERKKR